MSALENEVQKLSERKKELEKKLNKLEREKNKLRKTMRMTNENASELKHRRNNLEWLLRSEKERKKVSAEDFEFTKNYDEYAQLEHIINTIKRHDYDNVLKEFTVKETQLKNLKQYRTTGDNPERIMKFIGELCGKHFNEGEIQELQETLKDYNLTF